MCRILCVKMYVSSSMAVLRRYLVCLVHDYLLNLSDCSQKLKKGCVGYFAGPAINLKVDSYIDWVC